MCRMVGFVAEEGADPGALGELASCLARAAERDDLYNAARPAKHGDGWGAAVAYEGGGLLVYRSGRPIFEELAGGAPAWLAVARRAVGIMHARWASEGSKVGAAYSHPYEAVAESGAALYILAHNGSLDKGRLAAALGVEPDGYVDSELALLYLARRGRLDEGALSELVPYVRSALDLLVLKVVRAESVAELYGYSYWRDRDDEYYAMYRLEKGGVRALASSTVRRYCLALPGWRDLGELKAGSLEKLGAVRLGR